MISSFVIGPVLEEEGDGLPTAAVESLRSQEAAPDEGLEDEGGGGCC